MRDPAHEPRSRRLRQATPQTLDAPPAVPAAPHTAEIIRPTFRRGSDKLAFLSGFLKHPGQVGSVIPSSPQLENRLVRMTEVAQARTVVELGPGTGGTTRAFLRAGRPDLELMAIELSEAFHARLRAAIRDPRLIVQHGSAEHIASFLRDHGLPAPDLVVSGIPFSTMPADVADRIARAVHEVLAPGGRFVAYQLRAHVAHYSTPYFGPPVKEWEFINIPPMQVLRWVKAGG
jgi:phosphatidylethanolamine/phosphatidyl-N-methylethanolamine N-methyltransferase